MWSLLIVVVVVVVVVAVAVAVAVGVVVVVVVVVVLYSTLIDWLIFKGEEIWLVCLWLWFYIAFSEILLIAGADYII